MKPILDNNEPIIYVDESTFNFEIFPNPTMGSFNILFNDNKIHTVELFDVNGKMIVTMNNQSENSSFNLKEVASGTYTVNVIPENITYQIVKQ